MCTVTNCQPFTPSEDMLTPTDSKGRKVNKNNIKLTQNTNILSAQNLVYSKRMILLTCSNSNFLPGWFQNLFSDEKNQLSRGVDTSKGVSQDKRAIRVTVIGDQADESLVFNNLSRHLEAS